MDEFVCSCCGDAMHYDPAAYPALENAYVDPYAVAYVDVSLSDATWFDPYAAEAYVEPGWVEPVYVEEFYVEPGNGQQSYVEPAYVEQSFVEPAYTEPVYVEPAADVATIGGFDLNPGIAVVQPAYAEPVYAAPAANVATIGGFDLNAGITVVDSTYVEPAFVPAVANIATIGGFDLDAGISVVEHASASPAANQTVIGGQPLGDYPVADEAWEAEWAGIRTLPVVPMTDEFYRHWASGVVSPGLVHGNEVNLSNAAYWTTNWGPSSGTSYDSQGRLQDNQYGTRY